jgi:hypothetical protein
MRDCSKRWKNNNFPHIPYYQIPEHFTSEEEKKSSGQFFEKKMFLTFFGCLRKFLWCTIPFVEYDDL